MLGGRFAKKLDRCSRGAPFHPVTARKCFFSCTKGLREKANSSACVFFVAETAQNLKQVLNPEQP